MAALDGVARLYRLAKGVIFWGCIAGAAVWLLEFLLARRWGPGELIFLIVVPMVLGAFLWATVWIVEGFVAPRPPDVQRDEVSR